MARRLQKADPVQASEVAGASAPTGAGMKAKIGVTILIVLIAGCSGDKSTGVNQNVTQVNTYLQGLPTWAEFSPLLPDQDPTPTGAAPTLAYDTVASVTIIDPAGDTTTHSHVPYVCEATPYSVQKTPQDIVMYSPNAAILYPGAFIQGKSYKGGIGSLLPLNFAKRGAINVSIPAIQTGAPLICLAHSVRSPALAASNAPIRA